jgi:hypothetical protein
VKSVDLQTGPKKKETIDKKNGITNRQCESSLEDGTSLNNCGSKNSFSK